MSKKKEFKAAVTRLQQIIGESFVERKTELLGDLKTVSVYTSELSDKVQGLEARLTELQAANDHLKLERRSFDLAYDQAQRKLEQCVATYDNAVKRLLVAIKRQTVLAHNQALRRPVKFGGLQLIPDDITPAELAARKAQLEATLRTYLPNFFAKLAELRANTIELRTEDWCCDYNLDEMLLFGMLVFWLCEHKYYVVLRRDARKSPVSDMIEMLKSWATMFRLPSDYNKELITLSCACELMPPETSTRLGQIVRAHFEQQEGPSNLQDPPGYAKDTREAWQSMRKQLHEIIEKTKQKFGEIETPPAV